MFERVADPWHSRVCSGMDEFPALLMDCLLKFSCVTVLRASGSESAWLGSMSRQGKRSKAGLMLWIA